jgi:hypothetical protein
MIRKTNRLVRKMMKATSRRGFLGNAVKLATGTAAMLAGALAGTPARAGKPAKTLMCCVYQSTEPWNPDIRFRCVNGNCPKNWHGQRWILIDSYEVSDCSQC